MTRRNRKNIRNRKNKVIQKNLIKNVTVILILIVFLFVIYRFNFSSKSELTETVKINFKEFGEEISILNQEIDMEVLTDSDGTKYILLPEEINGYFVHQYHVTDNGIDNMEDSEELDKIQNTNTLLQNIILDNNENKVETEEIAGLKKYYLTSKAFDENSNNEEQIDKDIENNSVEQLENKDNNSNIDKEEIKDTENTIKENNLTSNKIENTNSVIDKSETVQYENSVEKNEIEIDSSENKEQDVNKEEIQLPTLDNIVEDNTGVKPGTRYNVYETEEKGKYTLGNISIEVEYQVISNGDIKLYNQELTFEDDESNIIVTGYMPIKSTLACSKENSNELEGEMKEYEDLKDYQMLCVYDISVEHDGQVYQPEMYDFAPSLAVNITSQNLNSLPNEMDVKVIHFGEDELQTIQDFKTEQNSVEFAANSFSIYAVISADPITEESITINTLKEDMNYYTGKNYTENQDGKNTNRYSEENLVEVTINYHGNRNENYVLNQSNTDTVEHQIQKEQITGPELIDDKITNTLGIHFCDVLYRVKLDDSVIINDGQIWRLILIFDKSIKIEKHDFDEGLTYEIVNNKITLTGSSALNSDKTLSFKLRFKGTAKEGPDLNKVKIEESKLEVDNDIQYTIGLSKKTTGYISADANEKKNVLTYKKYFPIEDGQINIELIDNPFMDRPVGGKYDGKAEEDNFDSWIKDKTAIEDILFGFNGWTADGYDINLNNNTKVQTLIAKADKKEMKIDVYADWKPANTIFVRENGNGNGSSIESSVGNFKDAVLKLQENLYNTSDIIPKDKNDRERNIIVIVEGNIDITQKIFSDNLTCACTITSLYNGIDYRNENNATVKFDGNILLNNDLQLDYLNVKGSNEYNSENAANGDLLNTNYINGRCHNLRIGRGMTPLGDPDYSISTFGQVQGGGDSDKEFRMIVESGRYANIYADRGTKSESVSGYKVKSTLIIGTDYDNILEPLDMNSNLNVYYRVVSRTSNGIVESSNSSDKSKLIYNIYIKSGTIGIDSFKENKSISKTSGVYIGGAEKELSSNIYDNGNRVLTIEGGNISNVVGGVMAFDREKTNTYIYIKGNNTSIQSIIGGAVNASTSGNRILQVTGGTIQYNVWAGSNGINSSKSIGALDGNTLVYIGGKSYIGGNNRIKEANSENNESLYGLEKYGCLFGAGNGNNSIGSVAGKVISSHILLSEGANIAKDVYGGGNFAGAENVQIDMMGGNVNGTIYGGTNNSGNITNGVKINITGGTIGNDDVSEKEAIFAGGYGNDTAIGTSEINITNTDQEVNIKGNIYGGSEKGVVTGKSTIKIEKKSEKTISIIGNVFGAGKGTETIFANNKNEVEINIDGGDYSKLTVFGGPNKNGYVSGNVSIKIGSSKETYVKEVYGGGNDASLKSENGSDEFSDEIYLGKYAHVTTNVFNGGNNAGISNNFTPKIIIDGATVTANVYGGSNTSGEVESSDIQCKNESTIIGNVYGAGKGESTTITENINIMIDNSKVNGTVYGGGDDGVTDGTTLITITNEAEISQVYGGGCGKNATVKGTEVNIDNSKIGNVYGGGKAASVTEDTNVILENTSVKSEFFESKDDNITGGNVFGAGEGEKAEVGGKTQVCVSGNSTIENIYGGGNKGVVRNSTFVKITSSTIKGNAYGAGKGQLEDNKNGKYALVEKGATIVVEGNTIIEQNIFGGGDASNIGKTDIEKTDRYHNEEIDDANSFVYISGATIKGNVYGGSNRAKIFGDASIYIGKIAVDKGYTPGKIIIAGTVFGGGETKGDKETYEYDFNSVNKNIYIDIDAEGYDTNENEINISGSIFGSGNNSNAKNGGFIKIKNYGSNESDEIDSNIKNITSIQRANDVNISNSNIKIEGTTDSTNQYASSNYTFNRVDVLTIKNNTTLYLKNGTNLLASFNSMMGKDGEEVVAEVSIGKENKLDRKVDNRIYAYDGKNINISNDETVTNNYGIVKGMTFFGIFKEENGKIKAGMYSPTYVVGNDSLEWEDRYFHRTYVLGAHEANQDTKKDGFYTVYEKFEDGSSMIKDQADNTLDEKNYKPNEATSEYRYINPTPEEGKYYMWYSGTSRIVHNYYIGENGIEPLRVSKYSTHGAVELPLTGISVSSATLKLESFSIDNWDGIELKPRSEISNVGNSNEKNFALVMETGNRGWLKSSNTEFLLAKDDIEKCQEKTDYEDKYYDGNEEYSLESKQTPTLNFLLYNSKNIEIDGYDKLLGQYKLKMILTYKEGQSIVEEDVMIFINIKTINNVIEEHGYNAAITYGKKYNLFPSTLTNITTESSMSVFLELSENNLKYQSNEIYRKLDTSYKLPKNTTITMIDKSTDEDGYYYYIVDAEDGENEFLLSEFTVMGNNSIKYDEKNMKYNKNDSNYHYEAFIFIIDFSNSEFKNNKEDKKITENPTVTLEMIKDRNNSIGMISSEGEKTLYNIYNTKCEIDIEAKPKNVILYIGGKNTFTADTKFETTTITINNNNITVYDTRYFNRKLGALITLYSYDNDGNKVKVTDGLKGTYFEIGNERYYPKSDGVTRVKMADIVSNVLTDITINTENSEDRALRPGKYSLKIEAFASADGIYYGTETEELPYGEIDITMISNEYGLKSTIPENQVIIDKTTGYTLKADGYAVTDSEDEQAKNDLEVTLEYKYSAEKPYITVELERRKYESYTNEEDFEEKVYSVEYTSEGIDLNDYVFMEDKDLKLSDIDSTKKIYEFLDTSEIEANTEHSENDSEAYEYTEKYKIKPGLKSGTYRLVFTLYDIKDQTETPSETTTPETSETTNTTDDTSTTKPEESKYQYIGEVYSYIIIK